MAKRDKISKQRNPTDRIKELTDLGKFILNKLCSSEISIPANENIDTKRLWKYFYDIRKEIITIRKHYNIPYKRYSIYGLKSKESE